MLFAFFLFLQQEPEQVDPSRWIMDQIRTYQQSGQLPEAKEAVLAAVQEQPIANYNYDQLQELVGLFYTLNERKKGDEILSRIPDTALNGPHLFNRCYDVAERMDGKTLNVMIAKLGRERPDYALDAVHNSFAQRVVFHYKGTQKERAFLETLARGPEKIDTFFLPLFLYSQWLWSPSDKERDAALDQLFASELPFASRYRLLALSKLPASESGWELELLDKEISGLKQKLADPPQFKNRRQRNNWEGRTNYHLAYAYALKAESAQAKKDYTAAKKWVEAASGLDVFQRFLDNESSWFYERVILDGFKEYHSLAARIYMAEGDLEKATRSMGRAYLQDKERRAEFKDFYTRWKGSTKGLDSFLYTLNDDNRSPMPSLTLEALDGSQLALDSLKGKVILFDFWTTWCRPCKAEMPFLERLYRELPKEHFALVAVSCDEKLETVQRFQKSRRLTYPLYHAKVKDLKGFEINGYPTKYLVGKDGRMEKLQFGKDYEEKIRRALLQ